MLLPFIERFEVIAAEVVNCPVPGLTDKQVPVNNWLVGGWQGRALRRCCVMPCCVTYRGQRSAAGWLAGTPAPLLALLHLLMHQPAAALACVLFLLSAGHQP